MKLTVANLWLTAAWREADRARAPETDLEHLYLGLIAIGGSAARLLGRHGISLASARRRVAEAAASDLASLGIDASAVPAPTPRPLHEQGDAGPAPTPRAQQVFDAAMRTPDTYGVLVALLAEPAGVVRRLVHADGVVPQDLEPELTAGAEDPYAPDHAPVAPGVLPAPAHAQQVTRFLSAPADVVADALADATSLPWWAYDPATDAAGPGDEQVRIGTGKRAMTLRFHVSRAGDGDALAVTWVQELLDGPHAGEPLGYDRFEARPAPGGCELTRTSGRRTFGVLGAALRPLVDRFSGMGLLHSMPAIAYHLAEGSG